MDDQQLGEDFKGIQPDAPMMNQVPMQPQMMQQQPPMMNVQQQQPMMQQQPVMQGQPMVQPQVQQNLQPQNIQQPANNLQGGVAVQLPAGNAPARTEGGITTFGDTINFTAIIFCVVGSILIIISPLSMFITAIVGSVFLFLAIFIFKKTVIVCDDNNRQMTIRRLGAIIPSVTIGGGEAVVGYDEIQDFVVRMVPGVQINNQPAANLVLMKKDGSATTIQSMAMYYSAMTLGNQLKAFLAQRVGQ